EGVDAGVAVDEIVVHGGRLYSALVVAGTGGHGYSPSGGDSLDRRRTTIRGPPARPDDPAPGHRRGAVRGALGLPEPRIRHGARRADIRPRHGDAVPATRPQLRAIDWLSARHGRQGA